MWAAQTRQPKPMLTTRKGLTSNHSFELEWSRALLAEQKCCCPQRHHVCDLWPQKPFSQSGLKGKEMKWCKKTPKPYLFILVSGPWSSNPGAVTHLATRQDTEAAAVVHHHLCLCSCLLAALLLVSVNMALQQPEAFVSFSMVLLSAWCLWPVACAVCFREVYFFESSQGSCYCCGQCEGKTAPPFTQPLLVFPLHFSGWKVSQKDEV